MEVGAMGGGGPGGGGEGGGGDGGGGMVGVGREMARMVAMVVGMVRTRR